MQFWVKVSNIHFPVEKCILFKKKGVSSFFMHLNVILKSQSDAPIFDIFRA